ncbi:MAG: hypothetical protein V8S96_07700 [Lachnospiraceae bacterium]
MNGRNYKEAADLHRSGVNRKDVEETLAAYRAAGITFSVRAVIHLGSVPMRRRSPGITVLITGPRPLPFIKRGITAELSVWNMRRFRSLRRW